MNIDFLGKMDSVFGGVLLILGGRDKGSDFSDLVSSLGPVEKIFCYGECGKIIARNSQLATQ